MLEELKYLVQLQEIDLRIKEQELAQENYPVMVLELKNQITSATESLNAIKEKMAAAEADRHNWEDQVTKAKEGLERSQERLNSIKTNREYDAVHAEIEAQKHLINGAEQHREKISAELEKLQAAIDEQQAELDRIIGENEPKIAEMQEKIAAIDTTIAKITEERDAVTPNIGKAILRQYNLIRSKRKTGVAISLIQNNKICAVCHKILEPQLFNEIRRGTKIILCQSCGSLMIWHNTEETAP